MSDRMRMLLTHQGPLKHVDHSHRARAAPAATGECLSMKVGANMLIRGQVYVLDPFLADPRALLPQDFAAPAVVAAKTATLAREGKKHVPEQSPGDGIVKETSFAYTVSSRTKCGMHPLRVDGFLVPSWEEAVAARAAIIDAAHSLFPDTVIGIWTKSPSEDRPNKWTMLFQYRPESYAHSPGNQDQEWGIYYYPDPSIAATMNKVAEDPDEFVHPEERRRTYVLRDLLKVQGPTYDDDTPTIYLTVYGKRNGNHNFVFTSPTPKQFEAFLWEVWRRGG